MENPQVVQDCVPFESSISDKNTFRASIILYRFLYGIRKEVKPIQSHGGFMTQALYDNLWHYTEQFTRDQLQRSGLLSIAYVHGKKLGERCTPGLMKSVMHYRSKELNIRSAFPTDEMGKSQRDAWNKPERVYLDKPRVKGEEQTNGDVVLNTYTTPLDYAITNDFLSSLSESEMHILEDLSAGYTAKEISQRHHVTPARLKTLRHDLETKAVGYLM
jgi:hypothetical protein